MNFDATEKTKFNYRQEDLHVSKTHMLLWFLGALQLILGVRVIFRLIRSARGVRIEAATARPSERVSIILPVLNETERIKACLDSLVTQSDVVAEILVVDSGSNDRTKPSLRATYYRTDAYG